MSLRMRSVLGPWGLSLEGRRGPGSSGQPLALDLPVCCLDQRMKPESGKRGGRKRLSRGLGGTLTAGTLGIGTSV